MREPVTDNLAQTEHHARIKSVYRRRAALSAHGGRHLLGVTPRNARALTSQRTHGNFRRRSRRAIIHLFDHSMLSALLLKA